MKHLRAGAAAICLAVLAYASPPALAQDEMFDDRIHSALPLYTFKWEQMWPRGFSSGDDFGCESRVSFGDWRFTPAQDQAPEQSWMRFSNYGVFHCAAVMRSADNQSELDSASWVYGYFVQLSSARKGGAKWELWALQKGMVPGSDYTLLARKADDARIERFEVLQRRCPPGSMLEAKGLDIWITRYCAIDSRAELLGLARRMLTLPSLGVLERVTKDEEPDRLGD